MTDSSSSEAVAESSDWQEPCPAGQYEQLWQQGGAPDPGSFLAQFPSLTPTEVGQVLLVDQQARWQRGDCPRAESYLARYPAVRDDREAALDLVYSEYLLAEARGSRPDVNEYASRFPELAEALRMQVALHLALPEAKGDASSDSPRSSPAKAFPTLPDYEIVEELGRGGMGVVYKAHQRSLDRQVAVKMILSGSFASHQELARFHAEAEAAAQLDHAQIVPIYEVGETNGHHFFSMKLIEGGSLKEYLPQLAADHRSAVQLLAAVAEAVHHAHVRGIIHRDLKPANILLEWPAGRENLPVPHITDFGLARRVQADSRLTQSGAILGTPSYMAPEQAGSKKEITTAADVYALGAILYEMVTCRPPFQAESPLDTVLQVLEQEPEPPRGINPKVDRDLELICLKCLAKNPHERYASAEALRADLKNWLNDEPLSVRPASLASLIRVWLRQNFGAAGWMLLIGLIAGVLGSLRGWLGLGGTFFGTEAAHAYSRLPGLTPPWLLSITWSVPGWIHWVVYLTLLILGSTVGLLIAALVRPKNRGADVAAGVFTGSIAGLTVFTLTAGLLAVITTAVEPVRADLRNLAEAAWSESPSQGKPGSSPEPTPTPPQARLLNKYPDLHHIPPRERGEVFYQKIRADMIAGIPLGIWIGVALPLLGAALVFVIQVAAAGPLLRQFGPRPAVVLPYFERVIPALALLGQLIGLITLKGLLGMDYTRQVLPWYLALFGFLSLTLLGTIRGWAWPIRLLLHVGWIVTMGRLVVLTSS